MAHARSALDGDEPLRVVVVDDEPLARADIAQLLVGRRGVSVVGSCGSGSEALELVRRLHPDVLLLDILMPGLDGFSVVARLNMDDAPYVVFVTAFDRYALDAFRVRALDYLLKPVKAPRLFEALNRARQQLRLRGAGMYAADVGELPASEASDTGGVPYLTQVMVRAGRRDIIIRVDDVEWIEADTYYARLHVRSRSYLLRERMHVLEARLDPRRFARVHRSAIVNLGSVREIAHDGHGDHFIVLASGARVKTSEQRWIAFKAMMRQRTAPNAQPVADQPPAG